MTPPTQPCSRCGEPIDQTQAHHVLSLRIERLSPNGRDAYVIEDESIEFRHLTCGAPTRKRIEAKESTNV